MIDTIAVWMIYIGGVLMFAGIMLMFMNNGNCACCHKQNLECSTGTKEIEREEE